jgi:hypothetical protein
MGSDQAGTSGTLGGFASMSRFVVTGCPRSGTKYTARLFRTLGISCGHEAVFGTGQGEAREPIDWSGFVGDSSWLAVPCLPLDGVIVLHQVRDPLEFARSIAGIGFLDDPDPPRLTRKQRVAVVRRYAPEVFEPETPVERAALFWDAWNRRAETHAAITYRLEDLDEELLVRLGRLLELPIHEDAARLALATVSRRVNRRPRDESVSFATIAPTVADLATRYGY